MLLTTFLQLRHCMVRRVALDLMAEAAITIPGIRTSLAICSDWIMEEKYHEFLQECEAYTVYSFEFAQSYFRPMRIRDWFAQSWIQPASNFPIKSFIYNSIGPVLNSPSGQRAKIKRGRNFPNFPCIQYVIQLLPPTISLTLPFSMVIQCYSMKLYCM